MGILSETLGNKLTLGYENDWIGRTTTVTLPDGSGIRYCYDSAMLRSVSRINKDESTLYTHSYEEYDLSGQVTRSRLVGNGGIATYKYDPLCRIVKIEMPHWQEEIIKYDSIGNIIDLSLQDQSVKELSHFSYDDLYQLTSESGLACHTYEYDSHHNRRLKDGKRHQLNALHQLIDDGNNTYSYDANGNLKEKKSDNCIETFVYDALDRLVTFTKNDEQMRYSYDETNRRLAKSLFTSDGNGGWIEKSCIRYLYQGQNEIGNINENGKITELRIIGVGKGAEIGAAVAMEIDDDLYVPFHDHIGNVSCLLDPNTGLPVETYHYTSFGEELFDTAISPWRYASKRTDQETGFVYFGRRYYNPDVGRWITPDPIGREGGINLYAYILNAPLTHFDLYGLFGLYNSVVSGLSNVMQRAKKFVSNILKIPGLTIKEVGYHLVPIPYVKDAIEFCGHCLAGMNPHEFLPSWNREHSKLLFHEGYGTNDPKARFVLFNGICTSVDEVRARMADFSDKYGGVTVYGIYNDSQGAALDLIEIMCQKLGIPTRTQLVAEKAVRAIMSQMGEYKDNGILIAEAHSQGAETVHNLGSDLKQRMVVTGLGPVRILRKKEFMDARNLINRFDVAPLLDPVGLFKGIREGSVHYMPTTGCPVKDHFYDSSNFEQHRYQRGAEYKSLYGAVL